MKWYQVLLPLEEIMTTNQPTDEHEGSRGSYTNLICIKNSFLIPFVPSLTPLVRRASWVRHGRSNIRPLMQEYPLMCVLFKLKMHFWFWRECKILHWAAEIKKLCGPRVNEFHCFSACKLSSNFVGCFNFSEISKSNFEISVWTGFFSTIVVLSGWQMPKVLLPCPGVGIYKKKQESKKTRKQELDQESD